MNILSKIMLSLISISVFVFLIFFTYITNSISNFEEPYFENFTPGLFELNKDDDQVFSLSGKTDNSEISVLKISHSDKVIFSSGSIETEFSSGSTNITLTNGIYFFDLKEINKNYIISGSGFEIKNKGPGNFIVNNLDEKKNLIFSINSVLDLNLKNYKDNTKITSLDLYPHTYLLFNPIKNIFVKNSDLLKISQTFNLGYFNEKILNENDIINEDFIDIATIKKEKNINLIKNSLLLIRQELNENKNIINNFLDSHFGLIPGETFINKYFVILKNPNKKSLYYKNLIIRNLYDLITSDDLNPEIINEIFKYSVSLNEIDPNGFNKIKNIINFYYSVVIKSNKNINSKINLTKLINKINNNNNDINKSSFLYLERIFFEYDFIDEIDFYKEFSFFRLNYFKDLNINLTKENNTGLYNIEKVDYLLFFIENILMSDFYSSNNNAKDLIDIFSDYVNIANNFYSNSDYKVKRTGLFTYSKILNNFIKIINNKYFLKERNENGLLEINTDENINNEDYNVLKENITKIIGFYNDNKGFLKPDINNKDKFVIRLYSSLEKKFNELFMALKNYSEYLIEYDQTKKELLSTSSINEEDNNLILSNSHATTYLNSFNGVQLKYVNISIMDYNYCKYPSLENAKLPVEVPYCYKIDNLFVDSNNVSFLLFPFEKNKIEEITVENVAKAGSYKLDEIKIELNEKIKTESKDKDKYEFKNFLAYTFGQQVNNNNNIKNLNTINETTELQEDSIVKIFKRNKLLGDYGDFVSLKGFLDINYNDLIVINTGDEYSINVKLGIFNIDLGRNETYYGEFSSMYNFSPNHSFINPKIKIINKKDEKDLLLGNYVYITGEYKVDLIQEEIKDVFSKFNEISFIVENIRQNINNSDIKITYLKESDKVLFETTYTGSKINITLDDGKITNFDYSGISKLESVIPYTELNTILNNIK